jgi:hypothetical protein
VANRPSAWKQGEGGLKYLESGLFFPCKGPMYNA